MAAIQYGSYHWCVILNGKEQSVPGESVVLHADELAIDPTAALIFKSAGRRPAGAEPLQNNGKNGDKNSAKNDQKGKDNEKDDKDSKDGAEDKEESMIYLAFAPGSWRIVYAAKLQDVVSLTADLKVKRESLAAARQLYEDTRNRVEQGTQAPLPLTSAQAQLAISGQDYINSEGLVLQQELLLKELRAR